MPHRTARPSTTRRLLRAKGGGAAAELAMIVPAALLLVAGIIEFGRLFEVYDATNRLASQYALAWANCSESNVDAGGVCSTEIATYTAPAAIGNVTPQLDPASLTLTMAEFTVSQQGAVTTLYVGGNSAGVQNTTGDATQLADAQAKAAAAFTTSNGGTVSYLVPGPAAVQYVVVVEVKYQHTLLFFKTLMQQYLANYLLPSYTVVQLKS
jgi:Flp pilus assembly protein TadG